VIYLMSNHSSVWKLREREDHWGWMIGHDGWRTPVRGGDLMPYALDNGMYFPSDGKPHGHDRLCEFFARVGKALAFHHPLFAIIPDMPYSAGLTEYRYTFWNKACRELAPLWRWAIAVQDGMTPETLERLGVGTRGTDAVAVGGSDAFKKATIPTWACWCRSRGLWCHVLRVNGPDRLRVCMDEGVDSVDGTGLFPSGARAKKRRDVVSA